MHGLAALWAALVAGSRVLKQQHHHLVHLAPFRDTVLRRAGSKPCAPRSSARTPLQMWPCTSGSQNPTTHPVDVPVEEHLAKDLQLRRLVAGLQGHVGRGPVGPHAVPAVQGGT